MGKNGLVENSNLAGLKYLWSNFLPNNLAWPILSDKLKSLIKSELTGYEGVIWMKTSIKSDIESKSYYSTF